jgi:hypothetical protein
MRRRPGWVLAWALAGIAALATGTAYATGFVAAPSSAVDTAHGAATPLFGSPPSGELPLYPGAVTSYGLTIGFDGLWGQIAHDTRVFTVAVPTDDPRTDAPYPPGTTFSVNVFVTNQPEVLSGGGGQTSWTTLQLQWSVASCPGGVFYDETSASPTFASPLDQAVMAVTAGTVHVALTGLSPGSVYCVGITQAYPDANDPSTTDLQRPYDSDADAHAANPSWTSDVPVPPQLTAQLQQT